MFPLTRSDNRAENSAGECGRLAFRRDAIKSAALHNKERRERRRRIDVGIKRAGPVDAMVGRTIRMLRLSKGVSQGALGKSLGVSFQQVQKYENGANRVGAGRLIQIAVALEVPVDTLLQGAETIKRKLRQSDDPVALLSSGQAMRMAKAFSQISDNRIRVALVGLAEGIVSRTR
jgi:transcriptional regulator with XRE-family HTH domain